MAEKWKSRWWALAQPRSSRSWRSRQGLILLDLNLPFIDGLEVCRLLRGRKSSATIPIIMVTARTGETDRVNGLDLGADDYVTKPFSLRELVARVRAVLRRPPQTVSDQSPGYQRGPLAIDFDAVSVRVSGTQIRLTKREFELLRFLVENRNRVLSRDRLLERVLRGARPPGRNAIGRRARRPIARQARPRRAAD